MFAFDGVEHWVPNHLILFSGRFFSESVISERMYFLEEQINAIPGNAWRGFAFFQDAINFIQNLVIFSP